MKSYIAGFFRVVGVEGEIQLEVESTGRAKADYKSLDQLFRKTYPKLKPGQFRRVSSKFIQRAPADDVIDPTPGMTLRNLFPDQGDGEGEESLRSVGTVFFQGQHCNVTLRYHRAKATVGLSLGPIMGGAAIRFTNQFQAGELVDNLDRLLRETFGNDGRELKLRTRQVVLKNESAHIPGQVIPPAPKKSLASPLAKGK
jgi:hypothetical protein